MILPNNGWSKARLLRPEILPQHLPFCHSVRYCCLIVPPEWIYSKAIKGNERGH